VPAQVIFVFLRKMNAVEQIEHLERFERIERS